MERTESVWNRSQPLAEQAVFAEADPLREPLSPRRSASLLFVDTSVRDYQSLIAANQPDVEVHVLDSSQAQFPGGVIAQITQTLRSRTGISSLQFLAHGEAGGVQLGTDWLNAATLKRYSDQLQSWATALTDDADIRLYGCKVGKGAIGEAFVQELAQLTQADIAASNDLTGNGGDWELEVATGAIEASSALDVVGRSRYAHVLAAPVVQLPGNNVAYQENGAAVTLDSGAVLTDDGATLNGGNLTVAVLNATSSDRLLISSGGSVSLNGTEIRVNNQRIGAFKGGYGTENLVITFDTTAATPVAAQAVLRNIAYLNTSDNIADSEIRDVEIRVNDGQGGISAPQQKRIFLTGVTDPTTVAESVVLYDGNGNPSSGSWFAYQDSTAVAGGNAQVSPVPGGVRLTTDRAAYAGFSNYAVNYSVFSSSVTTALKNPNFPVLDRTQGFTLSFTAQLNAENHTGSDRNNDGRDDRAGFSVVLISNDLRGIELGFWSDRIWAQEDSTTQQNKSQEPTPANPTRTLFTQAEFTTNVTTTVPTNYDLTVLGNTYTLYSNGVAILSGTLRDYTHFTPQNITGNFAGQSFSITPPNPYAQKNLVFFGDNTPSSSATVTLQKVAVSPRAKWGSVIGNEDSTIAVPFNPLPANANPIRLRLSSTNGTVSIAGGSGNGTNNTVFEGTVAQLNTIITSNGISFRPAQDFFGSASIQVTVEELGATVTPIANQTISVQVTPVNDAPSFVVGADQVVKSGAGLQSIANWATGFNSGQPNENQTIARYEIVGITNNNVFSILPTISNDGTLTYRPVSNLAQATTATIRVRVVDSGSTDNGGVNRSAEQTFTISVDPNPANQLAWRHARTGEVVLWNAKHATFETATWLPTVDSPDWQIDGAMDYDGDGDMDLLWRNYRYGSNVFWRMDGTRLEELVWLMDIQDTDWKIVGSGHFNGDRDADLFWHNYRTGETALWEMENLRVKTGTFLPTVGEPGWRVQQFGDFNGDAKVDVLWRKQDTGSVVIWEMNNTTVRPRFLPTVNELDWQIVGTGDTNGDGKSEILWYNRRFQTISTWVVQANDTIQFAFTQGQDSSQWFLDRVFDFDHDRKLDYVWRNTVTGENEVWLNRSVTPTRVVLGTFSYDDWQLEGIEHLTNA